jgi:hypothetical protein
MLKTQVVTNTWKCDACGAEVSSVLNPFFSLSVKIGSLPQTEPFEVDYCSACIQTLTAQQIIDYVASVPEQGE